VLLRRVDRTFPLHVNEKLNQLKQYQAKYGKMVSVFLLGVSLLSALGSTSVASAQGVGVLEPPVITTVSRNITNEEIFYIGGRTRLPDTEVTIYLQDLQRGETMYGWDTEVYKKRFEAFGWSTVVIDGHSINEITEAFKKGEKSDKPLAM
jgi:hypothetical protein